MIHQTIRRAQAYYFFSLALLYPGDNWIPDLTSLQEILRDQDILFEPDIPDQFSDMTLSTLQALHREVFGLTGSLFYETELGLPHEFRQSQELADIAGFYHAFGFRVGAAVRERPDHLAAELEFMYVLALKEAYALENSIFEMVEICQDAERKFLQDHLARWTPQFCKSLQHSTADRLGEEGLQSPYILLAQLLERFIASETSRLGLEVSSQNIGKQNLTPYNPDYSCSGCAVAETNL